MKLDPFLQVLKSTKFVSLVSRRFEHNGAVGEWVYATRRKEGIIKSADAVVIIPMTRDGDYVLNLEFRVPLKCREISFPAGLIEEGETPEEAAIRELKEETGYHVDYIIDVSPPLANSAGITDEMSYIVRCVVSGPAFSAKDKYEDIQTFLARDINDERLPIPCGSGIVWGAKTWMELYHASLHNR